jgi:multicomponent Na+:H+ antiporter subunit E
MRWSHLLFGLAAFLVWLLLSADADAAHLLVGAVVAVLATALFGAEFVREPGKVLHVRRWLWFLVYLVVVLWECFKANLDVAYRVLHPALPIRPGIVRARTTLKTEIARTVLANSITMTPGTLSVDYADDDLFVHWISIRDREDATERIVARFERILTRVFE